MSSVTADQLRARVRALLVDTTGQEFGASQIDEALQQALEEYSRASILDNSPIATRDGVVECVPREGNPEVIFGTTNGVENVGSASAEVHLCIAEYRGVLYLGTGVHAAIFRSYDRGLNWTRVFIHPGPMSSYFVQDLCGFGNHLYAYVCTITNQPGATIGEIFRSADGATWEKVLGPVNALSSFGTFCIFGAHIYVGIGKKVYRSGDGVTWSSVVEFAGIVSVKSLCTFDGRLYAATERAARIYRSADGETWQMVLDPYGTTFIWFQSLCEFGGRLYAGLSHGGVIWRSADGGVWEIAYSGAGISDAYVMRVFKGYLYVGSTSGQLHCSIDGVNFDDFSTFPGCAVGDLFDYSGYLYIIRHTVHPVQRTARDWVILPDLLDIADVWYPWDSTRPMVKKSVGFTVWRTIGRLVLRLSDVLPDGVSAARVFYYAQHQVAGLQNATRTTLPSGDEGLIVRGAAGYVAAMMAADKNENADRASMVEQWRRIGEKWIKDFRAQILPRRGATSARLG